MPPGSWILDLAFYKEAQLALLLVPGDDAAGAGPGAAAATATASGAAAPRPQQQALSSLVRQALLEAPSASALPRTSPGRGPRASSGGKGGSGDDDGGGDDPMGGPGGAQPQQPLVLDDAGVLALVATQGLRFAELGADEACGPAGSIAGVRGTGAGGGRSRREGRGRGQGGSRAGRGGARVVGQPGLRCQRGAWGRCQRGGDAGGWGWAIAGEAM